MLRITKKSLILPILTAGMLFLFNACDDDSTSSGEIESQLEVYTATDIPANPTDQEDSDPITYYSLREQTIVSPDDSATTDWDIAFSGTAIYTNSESSGPGSAGAIVLDQSFESTTTAPSSGYAVDTTATKLAITEDDEASWYNYTNMDQTPNHAVLPIDNKTIVVRTADGDHYAKIKILSYYKGNPEITSDMQFPPSGSRYYTFEYAIQMNGTTELN